jgi:hypothetical protein
MQDIVGDTKNNVSAAKNTIMDPFVELNNLRKQLKPTKADTDVLSKIGPKSPLAKAVSSVWYKVLVLLYFLVTALVFYFMYMKFKHYMFPALHTMVYVMWTLSLIVVAIFILRIDIALLIAFYHLCKICVPFFWSIFYPEKTALYRWIQSWTPDLSVIWAIARVIVAIIYAIVFIFFLFFLMLILIVILGLAHLLVFNIIANIGGGGNEYNLETARIMISQRLKGEI